MKPLTGLFRVTHVHPNVHPVQTRTPQGTLNLDSKHLQESKANPVAFDLVLLNALRFSLELRGHTQTVKNSFIKMIAQKSLNFFMFLLEKLRGFWVKGFPGQMGYLISPSCSGTAPRPPPSLTSLAHLHREESTDHPAQKCLVKTPEFSIYVNGKKCTKRCSHMEYFSLSLKKHTGFELFTSEQADTKYICDAVKPSLLLKGNFKR